MELAHPAGAKPLSPQPPRLALVCLCLKQNEAAHSVHSLALHPNSGLPEFGIKTDRSRVDPTSVGERVARALSASMRVFYALWRGPGEGLGATQILS
jgi:hypothetical protein